MLRQLLCNFLVMTGKPVYATMLARNNDIYLYLAMQK
ncbi:hypothetical protein Rsl_1583 [Rickettsia slovaca 13-B]|uniref:Uncharacterized protein n=1 Tax=Rickettsia slovaca (strain 13-B) TaxID=941638 RepID=A0ABM5MNT2_RICS1|nr:hypothetical protein Rsl_1583 [Rickettsia slovaca 13-B]